MLLRTTRCFPLLSVALCAGVVFADDAKEAPKKERPELTAEAQAAADELLKSLPPDSEARKMLDDILDGRQLGATDGWFSMSKAHTRYPWATLKERFDRNDDGVVTAGELKLSEKRFARLDKDGDGVMTDRDLDWSEPTMSRSPANYVFGRSDQDVNGKVTAEEFQELFKKLGGEKDGFVSLDEIREYLQAPPQSRNDKPADAPSASTLVLGLQRQEVGSLQPGPDLNAVAPDFTLTSLSGETVTLSKEVGEKPIVLIFGNFTCGPFRSQSGNIEKFYDRYRDQAKIYLVYVREAHPQDGWWMTSNRRFGIDPKQPQNNDERRTVAQTCQKHLDLDLPFLVDTVDDAVGATYSGMPNRLYVIDTQGKIAFKNARGPFGFKLREMEQALILTLAESAGDKKVGKSE
jgi:Ca2+-binding EF-hand superfamily protein